MGGEKKDSKAWNTSSHMLGEKKWSDKSEKLQLLEMKNDIKI